MKVHASIQNITMPRRIARLPIDRRGFPVPPFVAMVNGEPDHRVINPSYMSEALQRKICWLCGEPLGRNLAFLIGPMCSITRTISEPPSHRECAEYAVRACPFMARPHMHRRESGLPDDRTTAAGIGIKRNPGVICLWITRSFRPFRSYAGNSGLLFEIGDPIETLWFAEGRAATTHEVATSVYTGLPLLYAEAAAQDLAEGNRDHSSEYALAACIAKASALFPRQRAE